MQTTNELLGMFTLERQQFRLDVPITFGNLNGASTIQIVLPSESIAATQPQLQPALLSLSATGSQDRFTAAFPRRGFGNADQSATDPKLDRALEAPV